MGRHEVALADYDGALSSDAGFAPALLNRGAALMALRRFDEAVANNRQLIVLLPASADAYFNLAEALLGLGCGSLKRPIRKCGDDIRPGAPQSHSTSSRSRTPLGPVHGTRKAIHARHSRVTKQ
jgi:tetratricopeptide (TPR) repeat protein